MLLMTLSFVFGFLNTSKVKGLRNELTSSISAREISDRARTVSEKKLKASETDRRRLGEVRASLDQCWDLLRQRRARRNAGQDPDTAAARPPEVVERYEQ